MGSNGTHQQALDILEEEEISVGTGCTAGRDCSGEPFLRWTMAVWLTRALDGTEPPPVEGRRFADVDPNIWWASHVERLAELEVTQGCATGRYCPDRPVTRGQMATFLVKAFGLEPARSGRFVDTAGHTHEDAIDALAAANITAGCSTTPLRYCPDRPVTRGQMATFVARALDLIPRPATSQRPAVQRIAYTQFDVETIWLMDADGTNQVRLASDARRPKWSPDGTRIVYSYADYGGSNDAYVPEIWIVNSDGTNRRHLVTYAGDPAWSPDGTRLAYSGEFDYEGLWVMDADGGNRRQLTTRDIASPQWSPDGARIAFYEFGRGIVVVNADGTNQQHLATGSGRRPRWSPDGTKITSQIVNNAIGQLVVAVIDADGTNQRQLTTGGGVGARWSPDGTRIAFQSADGIAVINADGTNRRQLTAAYEYGPEWSPDGTRLAFKDGEGYGVMNADGTNQQRLVEDHTYWPSSGEIMEWSPDGTRIAYSQVDDRIWVVNEDSTDLQQLVDNGRHPEWSPDGAGIAYYRRVRGASGDSEVWVMNADGTDQRRLATVAARRTIPPSDGRGPRWSPDGTRIAYADTRGVAIIDTDGSDQRLLTTDEGEDPRWSPDGTRILYAVGYSVWVMNADGTNQKRLATNSDGPVWSPDGTRIAYRRDFDEVWVMEADGTQQRKVGDGDYPAWSPDGSELAFGSGSVVVVNADGTNRREVVFNRRGNEDVQWSPDGTMLSYMNAHGGFWVVRTDGTDHRRLSTRGAFPAWAP